jgi:hypothetical protein
VTEKLTTKRVNERKVVNRSNSNTGAKTAGDKTGYIG